MKSSYFRVFITIYLINLFTLIIFQLDLRFNGFIHGYTNSDDKNYFINGINDIYSQESKSYYYYLYNNFIYSIFHLHDVLPITFINTIIYSTFLCYFIYSFGLRPSKFFYLIIFFTPIHITNSLNYKDTLYLSCVIFIFSLFKDLRFRLNIFIYLLKLILIIVAFFIIENLRSGSVALSILSLLTCYLSIKYFPKNKIIILIYVISNVIVLLFISEILLRYLGKSLMYYWQVNLREYWVFSGILGFDIIVSGIIKTIFQYNYYSAYYFITSGGEHGYSGIILTLHYSLFVSLYPFAVTYILLNKITFIEQIPIFYFTISFILIYSLIYGGLVGLRLSNVYSFCLMIALCFESNQKSKYFYLSPK